MPGPGQDVHGSSWLVGVNRKPGGMLEDWGLEVEWKSAARTSVCRSVVGGAAGKSVGLILTERVLRKLVYGVPVAVRHIHTNQSLSMMAGIWCSFFLS